MPKSETTVSDRNHDFKAHHLALQVRVGIAPSTARGAGFPGAVVLVLADRRVRSQLFNPNFMIVMQATLAVVDEYAGCNMLRVYKGRYI